MGEQTEGRDRGNGPGGDRPHLIISDFTALSGHIHDRGGCNRSAPPSLLCARRRFGWVASPSWPLTACYVEPCVLRRAYSAPWMNGGRFVKMTLIKYRDRWLRGRSFA